MSDSYNFDVDSIEDIMKFSISTVEELQDILKIAETLKKKVESYSGWKGKQREELVSFLELLIDYHKDLVQKENCPFVQYKDSLKLLSDNLNEYTSKSKSYRELNTK